MKETERIPDPEKRKKVRAYNRKAKLEELSKIAKKEAEWYDLRPILGYSWAMFYILLGGREAGKSYSVIDFFCHQFVEKGVPFTWIRLTDTQARQLLMNNAEKLVDPDIRRRYKLDLITNGGNVYHVTKRAKPDPQTGKQGKIISKVLMARVFALSNAYNNKGSIFDKDFLKNHPGWWYNVGVDEFEREAAEKNTFNILNGLVMQLETLFRSTKSRIRIFFLGNTLEESSDILAAFNFIPETFGIFKLKSKRCVIQNIEPTEAYKKRRKGTIGDILMGDSSIYTNQIKVDNALITKAALIRPLNVIKFSKLKGDWFTLWDGGVITKYNGEKQPAIAMRPYLDEIYNLELVTNVISIFDIRGYSFRTMIDFKRFQSEIQTLKPRK